MTPQAIPRGGRMALLVLHLPLQDLVAGKAHVGTLRQKELVQLRLVGAVAFRAFP